MSNAPAAPLPARIAVVNSASEIWAWGACPSHLTATRRMCGCDAPEMGVTVEESYVASDDPGFIRWHALGRIDSAPDPLVIADGHVLAEGFCESGFCSWFGQVTYRAADDSFACGAHDDSRVGMVDIDLIVDAIVHGDDGGTYGVPTGVPAHRYVVGGHGDAIVLRKGHDESRAIVAPMVRRFVESNVLLQIAGYGVGFWRDANGRVWLDVVSTFANPALAGHAARLNGELAVWDSVAGSEIATASLAAWRTADVAEADLPRV